MFVIDLKSGKTIYEQVIDGFKELILSGVMKENDKMPSVRELSSQLMVNPNTIQKAYKSLEADGWIFTVSGLGSFVSEKKNAPLKEDLVKAKEILGEAINSCRYLGVDRGTLIAMVDELLEEHKK